MIEDPQTQPLRRPTLESVATLAGVGRGTASRVINGSGNVSPAARTAVMEAVRELGYVPNQAARALVRRRTDTCAFVVSSTEGLRSWEDPFSALLVQGATAELAAGGIQLLSAVAQSEREHARLGTFLTAGHIDGVLLASPRGDDPLPGRLEAVGVPTVAIAAPADSAARYSVGFDDEGGGRCAAEHLLRRGRRDFAVITGPLGLRADTVRRRGFDAVLAEAGHAHAEIAHGGLTRDSGAAAMRELLARGGDIDAVFATGDAISAGALAALGAAGLKVPDDVALIGFRDHGESPETEPRLTAVHRPVEDMGRRAARLLLAQLHGVAVPERKVTLGAHLVVRDST
ncbi:LacI family DNA-binding transcriptional regulator [Streptomyces scabiei]|uniref:LacI family DNA-binding transcriptional regulator n=1 Tax=Streptomyces scabiei TaxID=1930 RepID=UPI0029B06CBF|nr:LacI family DNA-binding transcriptional regulator [Streptomyces scabiei]MDX3143709.1 LacI family DNA-binding transcriptional regulator [Streptomyces scabiei]